MENFKSKLKLAEMKNIINEVKSTKYCIIKKNWITSINIQILFYCS